MYPVRSSEQLLQHTGQGDASVFAPADFTPINHFIAANHADKVFKEKQKAARDAKMSEQRTYNPDATWAPYQQQQDAKFSGTGGYLEKKATIDRQGITDPMHPDVLALAALKNEIIQNGGKAKDMQKAYLDAVDVASKDSNIKKDQAISEMNDLIYNEDGSAITPIEKANPRAFQDILNKPEHFNLQSYGGAVAKQIPESVRSYLHEERTLGGERVNEDQVKSKFHIYDNNGKLVTDPEGNPIVNVTPETKQIFNSFDPRAKVAVQYELNKQNEEIAAQNALPENKANQKPLVTEEDVIRKYLSPYAYNNINKNVGTLNKPNRPSSGLSDEEKINARHSSIMGILNGDQAEAGNLVGGSIDGRKIDDVNFVKNDVTKSIHIGKSINPETGQASGNAAGRAKNIEVPKYEVVFTMAGKEGAAKEIRLGANTKRELYYKINNVYNTGPGQNKISKELLDKNRANNPIGEDEEEDPAELNNEETKDPAGIL